MLGRNEWLLFTENEMQQIESVTCNFTEIAKIMGFNIPVNVELSEDKETVLLKYHTDFDAIEILITKSVVESWESTLNGLKGIMFDGLSYFVKNGGKE